MYSDARRAGRNTDGAGGLNKKPHNWQWPRGGAGAQFSIVPCCQKWHISPTAAPARHWLVAAVLSPCQNMGPVQWPPVPLLQNNVQMPPINAFYSLLKLSKWECSSIQKRLLKLCWKVKRKGNIYLHCIAAAAAATGPAILWRAVTVTSHTTSQ